MKKQIEILVNQINRAKNLKELCELLNELVEELRGSEGDISDYIDMCDLRVFGEEPDDTNEIWSYDDNNILTIGNNDRFIIESKKEFCN
jgi:hypothetical protein